MLFRILGPLTVVHDGTPLNLGGPRQRAVLARLLVDAGRVVSTGALIEDVWDGDPPPKAHKTLHKYVSELRRALRAAQPGGEAPEALRTSGRGYLVAVEDTQLDARRFEHEVAAARHMRAAGDLPRAVTAFRSTLGLWSGDVLPELSDSAFVAAVRTRLEELRLAAVEECLDVELALGRSSECAAELAQLVEIHPLRERLWALLMVALSACGRTAEALRAFQRLRRVLSDELGLVPSPELVALEGRILRADLAMALPAAATAPTASPPRPATNLPAQVSSFVGRERLLDDIGDDLCRQRLITLTGPGGSGKTRLAVEAASRLVARFGGGVWLVDLAPLRHDAQVVEATAAVLGIVDHAGRDAVEALAEAVGYRPSTLVVLDNCEHLVDASARLVASLLARCAELHVLATSRQPLCLPGETVRQVPPLEITTEAARLFCERARSARCDLAVTPADPAVLEICTRLDGLPLAVELAASAVTMFTPTEIAERIGDQLAAPEPSVATPARHRSVRTAVEWSHDLLSPEARILFRRLGVFAGPFSLDAAEQVAGDTLLPRSDVLAMLSELVRISLVALEPGPSNSGPTHYRMLVTIRALAVEQLELWGEREDTQVRHAAWCLSLAASAAPNVVGPDELSWRRSLDLARHDIRSALEFTRVRDPRSAAFLALALWPHWLVWGHFQEGLDQLRPLLDTELEGRLRAWVGIAAADLAADVGEVHQAMAWAEDALRVFTHHDDERGMGYAKRAMANAEYNRGNLVRAARLLRDATAHIRSVGDPIGLMHVTYLLGLVLSRRGDFEAAERTFGDQLRWGIAAGSRLSRARARWILGRVALDRGDYATARELCEASIPALHELDDTVALARARAVLADVARLDGDDATASTLYPDVLTSLREIGDQSTIASTLSGMAAVALRAGDSERAAVLFDESLHIRETLGDLAGRAACVEALVANNCRLSTSHQLLASSTA